MADGRRNNGGARKGAGRPRKVDEQKLVEALSPMVPAAQKALHKALKSGDSWAVKLFFEYYYGKPVQRSEISGPNGEAIKTDFKGFEFLKFDKEDE